MQPSSALPSPLCEKPLRLYTPRPLLPKLGAGELVDAVGFGGLLLGFGEVPDAARIAPMHGYPGAASGGEDEIFSAAWGFDDHERDDSLL